MQMQSSAVIIMGSSRKDGTMGAFLQRVQELYGTFSIVYLEDLTISPFDYQHRNQGDDFIPLIEKMLVENSLWIWATPVYWYTMSAWMKIFFDRLTDLLSIRKDLGRRLEGRKVGALVCSGSPVVPEGLLECFTKTAHYFKMNFLGCLHGAQESKGNVILFPQALEQFGTWIASDSKDIF
jgi:multimeric flavodoxin WrbA